jgi:hypothetical protein
MITLEDCPESDRRSMLVGETAPCGTCVVKEPGMTLAAVDKIGCSLSGGDVVFCADYGASAYQALRCAALVAEDRGRRLRIVRVLRDVEWLLDPRPLDELIAVAERRNHAVLDDMIALSRSVAPAVDLRAWVVRGSAYEILLNESVTAGLMVLGAGSAQPDRENAVSALGQWCLGNAACPVVILDTAGVVVAQRTSSESDIGRQDAHQ